MSSHNFKDLTGQTFNRLTVISRDKNDSHGKSQWSCECTCGNTTVVGGSSLKKGHTKSCGCLHAVEGKKRTINLIGKTFGRLTVISRGETASNGQVKWVCECICGNTTIVRGVHLRGERTKSCGCLRREITTQNMTIHGMERLPEYKIWKGMRQRCHNPNNPKFKNYGGRGITVCKEWKHNFYAFYKYIGQKPKGDSSVDRIDNDRGYCPGNVRWATSIQQQNNTTRSHKITINGWTLTTAQWAMFTGLKVSTINARIHAYGWPVEKAIFKPVTHQSPKKSERAS